ncbi:hypothetical protein K469DRAFT_808332 [Zopfia rhizophila CBS 207.26]|uniref:Lipocalin-like domain-containing protein n=1 Tax=Zopfia rhizophila CBS 207.26 TaxID=1314779 RepID=A0A6A6EMN5_9PEZI|nr:hypothetical protein K469DRAFT_808332 [Zopfia rhizophila CBS 207.26]
MQSPQSITAALAGAWIMFNGTTTQNGLPYPDPSLRDNPSGVLTYTTTGHVSANLASSNPAYRPNLPFPAPANDVHLAEWALVGKHTLSYAGPFSIKEKVKEQELAKGVIEGGDMLKITAWSEELKISNTLFWKKLA